MRARSFGVIGSFLILTAPVFAQVPVGGVYVDAKGVLRVRETSKEKIDRKAKAKAKGEWAGFAYVSLPRLFREVRSAVEAGKPIDEPLRHLSGMTRLEHVFVDPEGADLVIAGPAEDWTTIRSGRVVGITTGKPVLRLDDLVVALRTTGPGTDSQPFGCTIDLTQAALNRMVARAREIGSISRSFKRDAADELRDAVGDQAVRFFGVEPTTPFAMTCLAADYTLKRLTLGLMPSPVRGVRSQFSMLKPTESVYSRFWFVPHYEPLLVSADGLSYQIRGQALKLRASDSPTSDTPATNASAIAFAEAVTEHFSELAAEVPSFGELAQLTDLGVFAALVASDQLDQKAKWDLSWVLDPTGYPVPKVSAATEAESLVNYRVAGNRLAVAVGGVNMAFRDVLASSNRQADRESALTSLRKNAPAEQWFRRVDR